MVMQESITQELRWVQLGTFWARLAEVEKSMHRSITKCFLHHLIKLILMEGVGEGNERMDLPKYNHH